MSILFAVVFLVLIFKCVGLALRVCGTLLGALLSLAGFLLCRPCDHGEVRQWNPCKRCLYLFRM